MINEIQLQNFQIVKLKDVPVGSIICDNSWVWEHKTGENYSGYGEIKPVEWIVVAKNYYKNPSNSITLISKELVGKYSYRYEEFDEFFVSDSGWRKSNIRDWLNQVFYNSFSDSFKSKIIETTLIYEENKGCLSAITDNVFLPSKEEMNFLIKYENNPKRWKCFTDDASRIAKLGKEDYVYLTRSQNFKKFSYRGDIYRISKFGRFYTDSTRSKTTGIRPVLNFNPDTYLMKMGNKYQILSKGENNKIENKNNSKRKEILNFTDVKRKQENPKRVKIFTHTDFDGIGCGILGFLAFEEVDIEYCNYNDINEKIESFINNEKYKEYKHIYITDISVSDELAKKIDEIAEHFTLIDHHSTATHLNNYWWCYIKVKNANGKCSGTSLFYQHLDNDKLRKDNIIEFVETVRQYDTWEWATIYNNENPKKWNDLLYIYGREKFIEKTVEKLKGNNNFEFDETDLLLLELEENKKEKYFEKKNGEIIEKDIEEYNVGIVFAEQYVSELGNYLASKHNNLDFIILIGSQSISYRGIKNDIDLGLFAKKFGGGGHPKASGSEISLEKQVKYIEDLFS